MKPPRFLGRLVYFFGYPLFRILIRNTVRAYVVVVYNDKILLTKNWLGFQKKWRLAGGGVHAGEDIRLAAQRELFEEVGLIADIGELKSLSEDPLKAVFHYQYHLFLYNQDKEQLVVCDEREILEAKFVAKQDISGLLLGEEAEMALRLLGWS